MNVRGLLVGAIGLAAACGPGESQFGGGRPAFPDFSSPVSVAAAVAAELIRDPARADDILADRGLTAWEFEQMLYEVAADPILSEAYTRARQER